MSRFLFVVLLLVFNWPLLSIPVPENLFAWLFTAWVLAIVLLFLAARGEGGAGAKAAGSTETGGSIETGETGETGGPAGPGKPEAGTGGEGGGV